MKHRIPRPVFALAAVLFFWLGNKCIDGMFGAKPAVVQEDAVTAMSDLMLFSTTNWSPTFTPTPTPTNTPTPSPTPTNTPTPTPSPTPTNTPTPTPSPTPSATPTPTLSPTPSPSPTPIPAFHELIIAALLIDCETGENVYSYRPEKVLTPASVTKLMTALLALEHGNMEDVLTVTATALDVGHWDASMCGLRLGDQATLETVMYGLLLPSGNEAAEVIGEYISGDVESFVALMNARAAELGMKDTNFCNPHGLPDDDHVTTAYDMSLLMKELLKHDKFFEIAGCAEAEMLCTDASGVERIMVTGNTNQYLRGKKILPEGITILGGKTGFTYKAGRCLVMYVQTEDGKTYIAEMFGAQSIDNLYYAMNKMLEIIN